MGRISLEASMMVATVCSLDCSATSLCLKRRWMDSSPMWAMTDRSRCAHHDNSAACL